MYTLDIGCGGGKYFFTPQILEEHVIFADVDMPRNRVENFVRCDAHRLPFRHDCFSKIYASHLIEHLTNPKGFLLECRRVLKRGGTVHVTTPNWISKAARLDKSHRHVFNVLTLSKLLASSGYFPCPTFYLFFHRLKLIGVILCVRDYQKF